MSYTSSEHSGGRAMLEMLRGQYQPAYKDFQDDRADNPAPVIPAPSPAPAPVVSAPPPLTFAAALECILERIETDEVSADMLARKLGPWLDAHRAKHRPIRQAPIKRMTAIEVSCKDMRKGRKPPKRVRADQSAMGWQAAITILTSDCPKLSEPAWSGLADLRSPERARKDARKLIERQSISQDAYDLISACADVAERDGCLLGFLRERTQDQGMPFADRQIIMINEDQLDQRAVTSAVIITASGDKVLQYHLPPFAKTTSTNKALSGGYMVQSRGVMPSCTKHRDWSTGQIDPQAL